MSAMVKVENRKLSHYHHEAAESHDGGRVVVIVNRKEVEKYGGWVKECPG